MQMRCCSLCTKVITHKGRSSKCSACQRKTQPSKSPERLREYRNRNRDKILERKRKYYHASEKAQRANFVSRWKSQGIKDFTYADFERLLKAQNNLCAICKRPNQGKRKLNVDHNHSTGEARELLCTRCNHVVGVLEGSHVLEDCLRYLVKWNGVVDYQI